MDWTVYWFMFPACIVIASVAMLSGISGAAILSPVIILAFPILGVPPLAAAAAIGMSLFTEFFGFSSGVVGYARRCLIDHKIARQMIVIAVPFAGAGAWASHLLSPSLLKTVYGVLMFGLSAVLLRQSSIQPSSYPAALATTPDGGQTEFRTGRGIHIVRAADGTEYRYAPCRPGISHVLTALGALLAGMLSTGIGEIEMGQFVAFCRIPLPVAAGTSILIVAGTVAAGSIAHIARLVSAGGLAAVPWNLVVYTVPGAVIGGQIGSRLQGRVSEAAMERFMAGLFLVIGVAFLVSVWKR